MVLAKPMVITVVVLTFEPDFLLSTAFSISKILVWGQTDCSLRGIYNISKLSWANECIDVNGFGKTNGDNHGGHNIWARFFIHHNIFYKLDSGLGQMDRIYKRNLS